MEVLVQNFALDEYQITGSTAYLRFYSESQWTDADGDEHLPDDTSNGSRYFKEIALSVNTVTHRIDETNFTITSTQDAIVNQRATYTLKLLDANRKVVGIVAEGLSVPDVSPVAWASLQLANGQQQPHQDSGVWTTTQTIDYIQQQFLAVAQPDATQTVKGKAYAQTFDVRMFGAAGDGVTDDTTAIINAIAAAQLVNGRVYLPAGDYLVTAAASQIFLITKRIEMFGDGWYASRILVKNTTGATVDVFRFTPPASGAVATWLQAAGVDNHGYHFHDFGVWPETEISVIASPYTAGPGRHAMHFDISVADRYMYGCVFERLYLGNLGGRGMYFNNNNGANDRLNLDGFWGWQIRDNHIRNGIYAEWWGDTIDVIHNYFVGRDAGIESWQVNGATTLNIIDNSFTSRGGAAILHNGLRVNFIGNIAEMYVTGSTGSNSSILNLRGDYSEIIGVTIRDNIFNSHVAGNEMDGIGLDNTLSVSIDDNDFNGPATGTHYAIRTTGLSANTVIGINYINGAAMTKTNAAGDPLPIYRAHTINVEPDPASAVTFIPGYLGVQRIYGQSIVATGGASPLGPTARACGHLTYDSDAAISAGAYAASGGTGVATLIARDYNAAAQRGLRLSGSVGLFDFDSGSTFQSGTATAVAGAATLSKQSGTVTSEALTTAAGADYVLTLTNTLIAATSKVFVSVDNGTNTTEGISVNRVTPGAGSAVIRIRNTHAASALNGTIKINFVVF